MKLFKKYKYHEIFFIGRPSELTKNTTNWLNVNNHVKIVSINTLKYENGNPNDINDRGKYITFIKFKVKE